MRRSCAWITGLIAACGCGDNLVLPVGPPLAHSDTLFLVAHPDDDMIFMQPELLTRLREEATTTIYVTTTGPRATSHGLFEAAKVAYGEVAGSSDWECGLLEIDAIVVQHCRLRDRPVSLLDFALPDGGIPGDRTNSLLHLVDGTVAEQPAYAGGRVTFDSLIGVFAQVFEATTPDALETLELAGSHGRDHSSHMFVASFALWAAARVGYRGDASWHRGYNIATEEPTLSGEDLTQARTMLGYYEACADHCGPCGQACPTVLAAHDTWLSRQYSVARVPSAKGKLALGDRCLQASLVLGDCATAPQIELAATGAFHLGDECLTTMETGALALAPCTGVPEQYWLLDSEGSVWNGRPPQRAPDMTYDHVRCLAEGGAVTCGASLQAHWTLLP
ncbi:MAG TPA: hypothetical protein VLB44_12400 [Kofleriaceae bacterium]|nr:hypothetical protein [Kofleriaceae bacterium]